MQEQTLCRKLNFCYRLVCVCLRFTYVTLSFMLEKLEEQDTLIARDLKLALRERISQRRNAVLVSLLKLLNNPDGLEDEDEDALFAMSTDNSMMKIAKEIS